jgi:hypothetical protein
MLATVVKIDLCKSKAFAAQKERNDPSVRTRTLDRLAAIAENCFPDGNIRYPQGTMYKADGDALWYIISRSAVALRGAIEFMQLWFQEALAGLPECRVFLDRGDIDSAVIAGGTELTGAVFENISVFEKGLPEGRVFLTRSVLEDTDPTMTKFSFVNTFVPRPGQTLELHSVDFLDPRTVPDSTLVHTLFVAHPAAAGARERVFELILLDFYGSTTGPTSLDAFITWAIERHYSIPPRVTLVSVANRSRYLTNVRPGEYEMPCDARAAITEARNIFVQAQNECLSSVAKGIQAVTSQADATEGVNLPVLVEDYLCAVFAEIRMMANYFRATETLFESGPETFGRYDYILQRQLDPRRLRYFEDWRRGFLTGLQDSAVASNVYIASVFHNVLATYYLNRAPVSAAWQVERLASRQIFLDTNVLYSRMVPAAHYHAMVSYFIDRLVSLGVKTRIFPITLLEYEESLAWVEKNIDRTGRPSADLIRKNPWLYQEYQLRKGKYLSSIAVCRQAHSLLKDVPVTEDRYDEIERILNEHNVQLHRGVRSLTDEEVDTLWVEHRNMMTSNRWDTMRYFEFIYQDFPPSVRRHDMTCIVTIADIAAATPPDALGPAVMFITVDSKLRRLRKRYPFILTPEQFLEYTLPYLFLADIPIEDADRFPNTLLAAQLGTLLVQRPPALAEVVRACLSEPEILKNPRKTFPTLSEDVAQALNTQRFRSLADAAQECSYEQKVEMSQEAAQVITAFVDDTRSATSVRDEVLHLKRELQERDQKIDKLHKTVKYWRHQARK